MVYTYNQGVILSGQRGLFEVTGDVSFLEDGHRLIQSVINATGYDLEKDAPLEGLTGTKVDRLPKWHGLGRAGVLEEACDVRGDCSQDSQTFKGIFFHHLIAFCTPLEIPETLPSSVVGTEQFLDVGLAHTAACRRYLGWLDRNAAAALATRDDSGKFGMWWTAGLLNISLDSIIIEPDTTSHDGDPFDYRTYGVPNDPIWVFDAQTPFREELSRQGGNSWPTANWEACHSYAD